MHESLWPNHEEGDPLPSLEILPVFAHSRYLPTSIMAVKHAELSPEVLRCLLVLGRCKTTGYRQRSSMRSPGIAPMLLRPLLIPASGLLCALFVEIACVPWSWAM